MFGGASFGLNSAFTLSSNKYCQYEKMSVSKEDNKNDNSYLPPCSVIGCAA